MSLVFTYALLPIMALMILYMARHYIFTFHVMYGRPKQPMWKEVTGVYEPPVTLLIPAHNEEAVIGATLESLTKLTYPKEKLQVLVVDDASRDRTGEIVDAWTAKVPWIEVLHRAKGGNGKSRAMNEALGKVRGDIVLTFDADYMPEPGIVEKLVTPFIDPEVGGVQGRVVVRNEEDSFVSKIVTLERIGGFVIDQWARDALDLVPQYGGTVGGFRMSLLRELGGFNPEALTEDTDLTVKCVLRGYKVRYVPDAEAYEEAVTTWRAYWRQRNRWAKGHMQVALHYIPEVFRSKRLRFAQKVDMFLLLMIYFTPVIMLGGWILGTFSYMAGERVLLPYYLGTLMVVTYGAVGNFAPFFEVGMGAYVDRRTRLIWMMPALLFAFFISTMDCTWALISLLLKHNMTWSHTKHVGSGLPRGPSKGTSGGG